jgi:outer membrane protein assembly factor BamB
MRRIAAVRWITVVVLAATVAPRPTMADEAPPLCIVVMDPLASRLSCPCVKGYAQRDYAALAAHLEQVLGRRVTLGFGESLESGLADAGCPRADIVIGKDSVVRADGRDVPGGVEPLASLTDRDGGCMIRGLFVVPADDAAEAIEDLVDYAIYGGPAEHDEKHAVAVDALRAAGLVEPFDTHEFPTCSDAASELLELVQPAQAAAVISSYAEPLLEGCGTVPKGALRVVGETEPVRFITAFVRGDLEVATRDRIAAAISAVGRDAELCRKLESSQGFIRPPPHVEADWPGWRGAARDGFAPRLPGRLPGRPAVVWSRPLSRAGLGGLAATRTHLVLGDRDDADRRDVFRCLDAASGETLWEIAYDAPGELDYGNSPRATPLIATGRVYLLGAMGHLHCVDLESGEVVWRRHLVADFGVPEARLSAWGYCGSPLIAEGRLIVSPGGPEASVVALHPATGAELWRSPGRPPGYASFVAAYPGGRCQVIGFDDSTLGGWDVGSGVRAWTLEPEVGGGFHVPSPIVIEADDTSVVVCTENDGTRLHTLDAEGRIERRPRTASLDLAPEMATPVVFGGTLVGVQDRLVTLNLAASLKTLGSADAPSLATYAAVIAGPTSLLAIGNGGRLLMYDLEGGACRLVSEADVFEGDGDGSKAPVYSHPAIVGTRLFIRGANELACVELASEDGPVGGE